MMSAARILQFLPAALVAFHGLSEGYLTVRMADAANTTWKKPEDADCVNWGKGWYRTNCYNALRDNQTEGHVEFKMNSIEHRRHEIPAFTDLVDLSDIAPSREYYAYAVAEEFTVPETKDYTFTAHGNSYLFIAIDGELQGPSDNVWLISFAEESKRGTEYPDMYPLKGDQFVHSNRYPGGKEYTFSKRMEKGKKYKLEMFYAHHSATSYALFSTGGEAVPKEWFGEVVAVGNPEATWINPGLTEVSTGISPLVVDFEAGVTNNPSGGAVSYLWDFDGDGIVDETTTTAKTTHEFVNNVEELMMFFPSMVIEIDGKTSRKVNGPVIYVGMGDPAASIDANSIGGLSHSAANGSIPVDILGRVLHKAKTPEKIIK